MMLVVGCIVCVEPLASTEVLLQSAIRVIMSFVMESGRNRMNEYRSKDFGTRTALLGC